MNEPVPPLTADQTQRLEGRLKKILDEADAQSGTIHLFDAARGLLRLITHRGIPIPVLEKIAVIPIGKGMAGLAAERLEPVQICNLQTDSSGIARPGARETGAQGAVAIPILKGNEIRGVLGIAKSTPHAWSNAECRHFLQQSAEIVAILEKKF